VAVQLEGPALEAPAVQPEAPETQTVPVVRAVRLIAGFLAMEALITMALPGSVQIPYPDGRANRYPPKPLYNPYGSCGPPPRRHFRRLARPAQPPMKHKPRSSRRSKLRNCERSSHSRETRNPHLLRRNAGTLAARTTMCAVPRN
jgi:hypothetical protein